jgi:hypothetical protein
MVYSDGVLYGQKKEDPAFMRIRLNIVMPQFPMNDFWTAFSAVAAALTFIGGAYAFGRGAGYKQAMRDLNNER